MITFIYLSTFKFSQEDFIKQLQIYHSVSDLILIDNSQNPEVRAGFIARLEEMPFDHLSYIINDTSQTFGAAANQYLSNCGDDVLIVSPEVVIREEDIKEMLRVYQLSYHHAIVLPRTNKGHYQMIPISNFLYPEKSGEIKSEKECRRMAQSFRDYTIMPGAYDCCVLLDGLRLFDISGMNDEYLTMSETLLEFSLVVSNYGYITVAANHAYAENIMENIPEIQRFTDRKRLELRLGNELNKMETKFRNFYLTPQECFAERIYLRKEQKEYKKRLLYFLYHLTAEYNGSAVHALNLLDGLQSKMPENWEIDLVVKDEAADFFKLRERYPFPCYRENEIKGVYDVAFAPFHIFHSSQLQYLSKRALKVVCWPLDIIIDRSNYLSEPQILQFHEQVAAYSDGLVFLSKEAQYDYELYFQHIENLNRIPKLVCYIPIQKFPKETENMELPFEEFYLVFGNTYLHKMMDSTLELIQKMKQNFIVVGSKTNGYVTENIYGYRSGLLSDEMIATLYRKCKALLFPSIYEGFGLPVLQALHTGKNVYLIDTELNHELESLSEKFEGHVFYLKSLYDFPSMLRLHQNEPGPEPGHYGRTEEMAGEECWKWLQEVLEQETDFEKISKRWR